MLEMIKSIIERDEEFLESAQLIYEDAVDDVEGVIIVDDEDNNDSDDRQTDVNLPAGTNSDDDKPDDIDDNDDGDSDNDDLNIMNTDINNPDPVVTPANIDIFDTKLNTDNASDDDSDIFNMSIDIKTNTFTDILPSPPLNASDAVSGDVLNSKVGDGFTEAISIDAGANDDTADDTKSKDDNKDDNGDTDDKKSDDETNPVTDAVINKVNDADAVPTTTDDDARTKLLDKMDKLNKSIMDVKENIKKYIS